MVWRVFASSETAVDGLPLHFADRREAGRRLAPRLEHLRDDDLVVLGLPRGGVPVAWEVARYLGAPLDVIVVRKLGVPWQPELAMGAIGEEGVRVLNYSVLEPLRLSEGRLARIEDAERRELERRVEVFRGRRSRLDLTGRAALIVDDGVATGSTAEAACAVARALGADRIVLAAPVASRSAAERLGRSADEVVFLGTPEQFGAIGVFYADFAQTTDDEVRRLLDDQESSDPI